LPESAIFISPNLSFEALIKNIIKNQGGRLWFESVEGVYTKTVVDLLVDNGWDMS
jgi:hypothetical protein